MSWTSIVSQTMFDSLIVLRDGLEALVAHRTTRRSARSS
jgi:hypothetical protein